MNTPFIPIKNTNTTSYCLWDSSCDKFIVLFQTVSGYILNTIDSPFDRIISDGSFVDDEPICFDVRFRSEAVATDMLKFAVNNIKVVEVKRNDVVTVKCKTI